MNYNIILTYDSIPTGVVSINFMFIIHIGIGPIGLIPQFFRIIIIIIIQIKLTILVE